MFESIVGNSQVKKDLQHALDKNTLSHSLLFAGPEGVGKKLFAKAIAEHLLGTNSHPDLHLYFPEGKTGMHSLVAMRQLSEEVYLAPFSAKRKVFIIDNAERMLSFSANALLKTFEEPSPDSLIILISSSPAALLPTIRSRCFTLCFHPLTQAEIAGLLKSQLDLVDDKVQQIASQAQGSISRAHRLLEQEKNSLRSLILSRLVAGKTRSYQEIHQKAQEIAAQLEENQTRWEKEIKATHVQSVLESMNATQKQALEKEVEGEVSMRLLCEVQGLFDIILSWYRDMQLIKVNGSRDYLIHRDFETEIGQALQRGELEPLEKVQKALSDASLALERSTPLFACFENIFLRLIFKEDELCR